MWLLSDPLSVLDEQLFPRNRLSAARIVMHDSRAFLSLRWVVARSEHLTDLRLALPARPVFSVKFHEVHGSVDHLLLRLQLKDSVTTDDLFGLCERAIDHHNSSLREPDARTHRSWGQTSGLQHHAGFRCLFAKLRNGLHQFLGRRARVLGGLYQGHKTHHRISF